MLLNHLQQSQNATSSECTIVMFYYKWCVFSSAAAPHYNALGRLYPQFNVLAVDAYGHNRLVKNYLHYLIDYLIIFIVSSINMRFGLVGVPSILLFRNGTVVGKFNESHPTILNFVSFVTNLTGISPTGPVNVTEEDYIGPLQSSPQSRIDFLLLFSSFFVLICLLYLFSKTRLWKITVETIRNNWREAEAQHEHFD